VTVCLVLKGQRKHAEVEEAIRREFAPGELEAGA
jgi:hypothetical protein